MKTESGNYIPASYKSNIYNDWVKKNRLHQRSNDNEGDENDNKHSFKGSKGDSKKSFKQRSGKDKRELKTREQIISSRVQGSKQRGAGAARGRGRGGGSKRGGRGRGR